MYGLDDLDQIPNFGDYEKLRFPLWDDTELFDESSKPEDLNLTPFYELFGVVVHMGNNFQGHCISIVKVS